MSGSAAGQPEHAAIVRGRVVDGVTGRPVGRVRIELHGAATPRSVLASPQGEFEFTGLAAGRMTMTSEKSGYLKAWYPARPRDTVRVRTVNLGTGDKVENVVITMFRRPAITGHVVDEYGDPVENVHVRAWRVAASGARVIVRGAVATNDIGEYRLSNLEPGRYVVAARRRGIPAGMRTAKRGRSASRSIRVWRTSIRRIPSSCPSVRASGSWT